MELWMFLVHSGYLTCRILPDSGGEQLLQQRVRNAERYEFSTPNYEIQSILSIELEQFIKTKTNPVAAFGGRLRNVTADRNTYVALEQEEERACPVQHPCRVTN
jgi:hypothetical protein